MKSYILLPLFVLLLIGCQSVKYPSFQQTATATNGMVSTGQPLATLAGQQMLEKGGNAVDAAVASAFALAVVEPSMNGIGGRMQAIVRLPNGEIHGIDGTTQAPMNYDTATTPPVRYGYGVIGIPGVVAGLTKLQKERGKLPLATVMQPAIKYAKKGFSLLPGEAKRQAAVFDQLKEFEGSRTHFLKDGKSIRVGDKWVQKDLGNVLAQVAQGGHDAFYKGDIARKIVADFKANGGILTMEDLANYEAKSSRIVEGNYRGYDIHGLWLPSFGAITIEILHILENWSKEELQGSAWGYALSQAIRLAYLDRQKQKSEDTNATLQQLLSKEYAKKLYDQLNDNLGTGYMEVDQPESWTAPMGHTTHLTATDESGMMVALTQTIGPNMGSKVATKGLGFLYAVTLGKYLGVFEPGHRAASHVSPMIITKDGQPFMALGAAGGSRIPTAITAVVSRVIDGELSLQAALAAPRVYPNSGKVQLENHTPKSWSSPSLQHFDQQGIPIEKIEVPARFGRVHAVQYDAKNKRWIGGADPDWEGVAAGKE